MKKRVAKNKTIFIICVIFAVLSAAAAIGYFGYGATLLNPDSDKSIIASVSKLKHSNGIDLGDSTIKVLVKKQYGDYFAVLYQAVPPGQEEGSIYFSAYKKQQGYSNRYVYQGGTSGAWDMAYAYPIISEDAPSAHIACFFANTAGSATTCSVFECDLSNPLQPYVQKIEEFAPPQNKPYILVKEYDLTKAGNIVTCFDGSIEMSDLQ